MELIALISQVGFPIAIAIYLLLTRDKVISSNTEAIERLSEVVERLCQKK
jgi:hypothetical protein